MSDFLKKIYKILGEGAVFTVVDTPGFGDSEGKDEENDLIDGMMNFLKNNVTEANAIILLINGKGERFDYAYQQTIRLNSVIQIGPSLF